MQKLNWKYICCFAQAELGMKRFYLEHESNYKPNPIESAITSFNYISKSLNRIRRYDNEMISIFNDVVS
jgi:hypothetical protein